MSTNIPTGDAKIIHIQKLPRPLEITSGKRKDCIYSMATTEESTKLWTKGFILDTLVNFLIYIIYYMLMVIIASEAIHSLGASMSEAGLASGIFILGTLLARVFAGRSIELYGRKKMLYAGIIFYLVTTAMYFLIHSIGMLYLVRALNGIGYGVASTATSTIVSTMIPSARRGEGVNYYALSMSLAAAIGPFIGMILQQIVPFNDIVIFSLAMIVICLVAVAVMHVQEFELTEDHRKELQAFHIQNFLEPKVAGISIVAFIVAVCYSSVLSFLASYAENLGLLTAGTLFFVVYALVITLARPVAGVLFDRKGEDFVMYPTYACLAIGLFLLAMTTHSWMMLLAGVFVGLGYGTFMSNGQAICIHLVKEFRIGVAVSTYFVALDLGLGVGPYVLGALKDSIGFSGIYVLTGIGAVFSAILYYLIYARGRDAKKAALVAKLAK